MFWLLVILILLILIFSKVLNLLRVTFFFLRVHIRVLIILIVLVPLTLLTDVVTGHAIKVSQSVMTWVKTQIEQPNLLSDYLSSIPYYDKIAPHSELIIRKAGEAVFADVRIRGDDALLQTYVNDIFFQAWAP